MSVVLTDEEISTLLWVLESVSPEELAGDPALDSIDIAAVHADVLARCREAVAAREV